MEFFKNFFRDDDKVVGLCAFKAKKQEDFSFDFGARKFNTVKFAYSTNSASDFFRF